MDAAEIKATIQLLPYAQTRGLQFKRQGAEFYAVCPFHPDKKPSFRVDPRKGTWFCDPCGKGGSIIDFVMLKDGLDLKGAILKLGGNGRTEPTPVAKYAYTDENGKLLYQVIRYIPKTFRQRHLENGSWVWNMQGVRRVLYNLPEVIQASKVFLVEGEKDADNLIKLGYVASCNVGGAKKWMDSYSPFLRDKEVVVIPDNDGPGREHAELVIQSLTGLAKTIYRLDLGEDKDISVFITRHENKNEDPKQALDKLLEVLKPHNAVMELPIQSMEDLEKEYAEFTRKCENKIVDLSRWIPEFAKHTRPLVPGEMMVIVADTAAGKTAIIQNIAISCAPSKVLIFELELPGSLMFERFIQIEQSMHGDKVFENYKAGLTLPWKQSPCLEHIYVCAKSRIATTEIERIISQAELKMGEKPSIVMVDYIGLINQKGTSRYDRVSEVAEQLKVIAKSQNVVVIMASQIGRKSDDKKEITLHDAKDSGSVENSSGLVLGVWRDKDNDMKMRILKNTKGRWGGLIECEFDAALMQIRQKPKVSEADLPPSKEPYKD